MAPQEPAAPPPSLRPRPRAWRCRCRPSPRRRLPPMGRRGNAGPGACPRRRARRRSRRRRP
eukprot:8767701-Alexandrium_andersonii.AAC.1